MNVTRMLLATALLALLGACAQTPRKGNADDADSRQPVLLRRQ